MKKFNLDTDIPILGEAKIISPLLKNSNPGAPKKRFVSEDARILVEVQTDKLDQTASFEQAGPREKIYFDPSKLKAAIVTCGGLCPGLNDIIRSIVLELYHIYHVRNIYGIRYGLQGFIPEYGHDVIHLDPKFVSGIQNRGGSVLGSSRGTQNIGQITDCLEQMNIGLLFMVGGDGTLMASKKIAEEIENRQLKISVIGIPKTIDNDIYLVSRSFGFDTAVDVATLAIKGAHNEAEAYPNGIGLIKLMGRHSGFLAATSALAQQDANFVLVPEVDFFLYGKSGFLQALENRILLRKHAVIIVAEGAGQNLFDEQEAQYDPSGNIILQDIGLFLKEKISQWFKAKDIPISLKYIDPSYIIRSLPANANDSVFCGFLGREAVHAGMAGKTKLLVSYWNNNYVHVPMDASAGKRKNMDPQGRLWQSVLEATGQDSFSID
ncbi:MAG: ATP-dependent 6-phosphofructokinase [Proteobacteria bacterium]|nr:ATP-dependent 6-phosphofructokinase [Pseudomonadota bacterium]MBU1386567.1 ATP-dependent 6-phosphofructokinase [Pseudomonadota bacterium]MBU1542468.1 ATP-dependent 6-phosphofructokinase [Pseudomonadota bacterium]MBU2430585.1 ATP-dependent 6-phosphofructokinase [Pseudomonadota bacterium]MBU2480589.1 ATP-dependent 6-phosphofructokinase [Pseudomonadota bacterium]